MTAVRSHRPVYQSNTGADPLPTPRPAVPPAQPPMQSTPAVPLSTVAQRRIPARALQGPPLSATDNQFRQVNEYEGSFPVVGSTLEQARQSAKLLSLAKSAFSSVISKGRRPPDAAVAWLLEELRPLPVRRDAPKAMSRYTSRIPGAAPDEVYQYFIKNPYKIFSAAGINLRPSLDFLHGGQLVSGTRLMVEVPPSGLAPAMWMPIEVVVESQARKITLTPLDGHPFCGANTFTFVPDAHGGTTIAQRTEVQLTSRVAQLGNLFGAAQKQSDAWKLLHQTVFDAFHNPS